MDHSEPVNLARACVFGNECVDNGVPSSEEGRGPDWLAKKMYVASHDSILGTSKSLRNTATRRLKTMPV
jgi:hypothetical protein